MEIKDHILSYLRTNKAWIDEAEEHLREEKGDKDTDKYLAEGLKAFKESYLDADVSLEFLLGVAEGSRLIKTMVAGTIMGTGMEEILSNQTAPESIAKTAKTKEMAAELIEKIKTGEIKGAEGLSEFVSLSIQFNLFLYKTIEEMATKN